MFYCNAPYAILLLHVTYWLATCMAGRVGAAGGPGRQRQRGRTLPRLALRRGRRRGGPARQPAAQQGAGQVL